MSASSTPLSATENSHLALPWHLKKSSTLLASLPSLA
jgi:hypothetical protein